MEINQAALTEAIRLKEFATSEKDLEVIDCWISQYTVWSWMNKSLHKIGESAKYDLIDQHRISLTQELIDSECRDIKANFPYMSQLPQLQFTVRQSQEHPSMIDVVPNTFSASIMSCIFGQAAYYADVVRPRLQEIYKKHLAQQEDERSEARSKTIVPTGIKRYEYPSVEGVTPMTPEELRASGLLPAGYELVDLHDLGHLLYAGEYAYETACAGHYDEIQACSVRVKTLLENRCGLQFAKYNEDLLVTSDSNQQDNITLSLYGADLKGRLTGGGAAAISKLYVPHNLRRQGVGAFLVRHFESLARANSAHIINVSVHEQNKAGSAFWEAMGYIYDSLEDDGYYSRYKDLE